MRLQLILGLVLVGDVAAADPGASGTLRVYADDDHVTVVSPAAAATVALDDDTTLDVDTTADAISCASIDVISAASPRAFRELRVELGAGVTRALPVGDAASIAVGARASHEEDFDALRAGASLRVELDTRMTTLEVRYLGGRDAAGDVTDATFERTRAVHDLAVTASRILGRRTVIDAIVDASLADGYHASPYRDVPITDPAWPLATWVDEATPRVRRGLAVALRGRHAIGSAWFLAAGHRAYADDWSVTSHTTTVEARRALGEQVLVGATLRGYVQDGADFYRGVYVADEVPALRTRDRTLGPMRTAFASVTADLAVADDWHVVAAGGVLAIRYLDAAAGSARNALLLTLSLSAPF